MRTIPFLALTLLIACQQSGVSGSVSSHSTSSADSLPRILISIGDIPLPAGYKRISTDSFGDWLHQLPLKKEKTVYLFNGEPKRNQSAQYAVIDMSTGTQDLQQCADVVMRLRAEYLYHQKNYRAIHFTDFAGKTYTYSGQDNRVSFDNYLLRVFGMCGSASLEKEMKKVPDFSSIRSGDVLVHGGFPGHAMLVADIAVNAKGEKIYLLVQGYTPAQDMHVVVNPGSALSPWYAANAEGDVFTPEWVFKKAELKRW